jgi:hypothetical protein
MRPPAWSDGTRSPRSSAPIGSTQPTPRSSPKRGPATNTLCRSFPIERGRAGGMMSDDESRLRKHPEPALNSVVKPGWTLPLSVLTLITDAKRSPYWCLVSVRSRPQKPFATPHGAPITAERAVGVVNAVLAEARNYPTWRFAISVVDPSGELVYFYKMDDTLASIRDLAKQGADRGAVPARNALVLKRVRGRPSLSLDVRRHVRGVARRLSAHRSRETHWRGRLQRRDRRSRGDGMRRRSRFRQVGTTLSGLPIRARKWG